MNKQANPKPQTKTKQKSKREWNSNTETVFLGYNDATASQITVTYMQDFSISVVFLLLFIPLCDPASSEYQGSSQPHHEC